MIVDNSSTAVVLNANAVASCDESSSDFIDEHPRQPQSMVKPPFFPIAVFSLILQLVASIIIMILIEQSAPLPTSLYLSEHEQLIEDWKVVPFVQIELVSEGGSTNTCQAGFEPMFTREWGGT